MVDKPYEKVEELYKFVNKPVTEKVTSFVDTSMNGKKASSNYNVSFAFVFFAVENNFVLPKLKCIKKLLYSTKIFRTTFRTTFVAILISNVRI